MDGAGAGDAALRRHVVFPQSPARVAAAFETGGARRSEPERPLEQAAAAVDVEGVRPRGVESLQRELLRHLRVLRHQLCVRRLDDA